MTKQSRSILTIAGLVIALVIASVVAVLVFAPAANHFAPGSPEDVFQRYLTSYEQREFTTAYGFFSTRAQKQLSLDQYSTYATSSMTGATDQDARITVNRVEGSETSKTLYLTVEHVSGGGIELNTWTYDLSVPLVRESGEWKIDQLLLGTSPAPVLPLTK